MTALRVLFITGREITYARNEVLLRAFRRFAEVDVVAVERQPRSLWANSVAVAARAAPDLRRRYDLVFIGFYGHLLVQLLRGLVSVPILFDAFISTYDTLCFDRRVFAPDSVAGRLAFWLDRSACAAAAHVILDTEHHADYFAQTFRLPRRHFTAIPVGCSEAIYCAAPPPAPRLTTQVLSYTTFLPLHGVETTLRAASLLAGRSLHFRLIGSGPTLAEMKATADALQVATVTFEPPVPPRQLAEAICAADIGIGGHFGPGDKAARVIPGKIYQMLAVGRAVIAADAPGNRELLRDGESALLIPPADPAALAVAVAKLQDDRSLRNRLAQQGHTVFLEQASEAVITRKLLAVASAVL